MGINVEIISKELIKPSSPTPPDLRNFKLSFLDQIVPPIYVPIILFYQSEFPSNSLKQSLSQSLTRFYPLAGRLNEDGVSVDCNDAGVEYVDARNEAQISQVIDNPNMEELTKFLPINPYDHTNNVVLLAVQINSFVCGGLAIAVCVSHKIADGLSLVSFINSWASESIGKTEIPNPDLNSAFKLFPPIDDVCGYNPISDISQGHVVTKRLVFDKKKITTLKQEMITTNYKCGISITPTRVEAVSAFIWKQLIKTSKLATKEKVYVGVHNVNLRPKASPPLGDLAFGNIWRFASAVSVGDERQLVGELRDAIGKIDGDFVEGLKDGEKYMEYLNKMTKGGENYEVCCFSSWCRFPVYEADYGWGKPVWVCTTTMPFKNVVILMSSRYGDGIEAWVNVVESDMAVIEAEHKLL